MPFVLVKLCIASRKAEAWHEVKSNPKIGLVRAKSSHAPVAETNFGVLGLWLRRFSSGEPQRTVARPFECCKSSQLVHLVFCCLFRRTNRVVGLPPCNAPPRSSSSATLTSLHVSVRTNNLLYVASAYPRLLAPRSLKRLMAESELPNGVGAGKAAYGVPPNWTSTPKVSTKRCTQPGFNEKRPPGDCSTCG